MRDVHTKVRNGLSKKVIPTKCANNPAAPNFFLEAKAYALTSDRETFTDGATAFRNARDMAKQHRDKFMDAANTHANTPIGQDDINNTIKIEQNNSSSSSIVVNDLGHIPQHAHDEIQRDIWNQSFNKTPILLRYLETDKNSQNASQESAALDLGNPSTSFVTSFTSSFSIEQASCKRSRQS
ncbi:hypothetical protein F4823DRAFT_421490 [Ustulina deusta]|nr:hypothetical protein F4823DRAFT_421490 [Ustulina deusta]